MTHLISHPMRANVAYRLASDHFLKHTIMTITLEMRMMDPCAVYLVFPEYETTADGDERPVTWVFARELLALGVYERAGDADVIVTPQTSSRTIIHLKSPDGEARVTLNTCDIDAFITASYNVAPIHDEESVLSDQVDTFLVTLFNE